jgi:hypothetical protein
MAAGVAAIYAFFAGDGTNKPSTEEKRAYPLAKFRTEWNELSVESKAQISEGIGNGTFTY